jgi:hypothetical protein
MATFGPESPISGLQANILTNRNGSIDTADSMHTHSGLASVGIACDAGILVGDFVYVDAADHVTKAADNTISEIAGVVVEKTSITNCIILNTGRADVFSGLTPGQRYFLSASGIPTTVPPASAFVIPLGIALSTTDLMLNLSLPMQRAS